MFYFKIILRKHGSTPGKSADENFRCTLVRPTKFRALKGAARGLLSSTAPRESSWRRTVPGSQATKLAVSPASLYRTRAVVVSKMTGLFSRNVRKAKAPSSPCWLTIVSSATASSTMLPQSCKVEPRPPRSLAEPDAGLPPLSCWSLPSCSCVLL